MPNDIPEGGGVAVFVDVENVTAWLNGDGLSVLMDRLATEYATVVVRRAYGNWASGQLAGTQRPLHRHGFELVHVYHPVSGKNSADIQIVVDAMETLDRRSDLRVFVLVTGDSDFSPLFRRLRERGKTVVGVGPESPLSDSVLSSCDRFIYTARRKAPAKPAGERAPRPGGAPNAPLSEAQVIAFVDKHVPPSGSPVRCNNFKEQLLRIDPAFGERVPGSFLKFLQRNPGAWRVFAQPPESDVWCIEQRPSAPAGTAAGPGALDPTPELYATLLRQKAFPFANVDDIWATYEILSELAAGRVLTGASAADIVLGECEETTTEDDVRRALRGLIIAGATEPVVDGETSGERLRPGLTREQLIEAYDVGALGRLQAACRDRRVAFKPEIAALFLAGDRGGDRIARLVTLARQVETRPT